MIKSTLLGLLGAGAIGSVAICDLCRAPAQAGLGSAFVSTAEAAPVAEPKTVTLKVEGMTCGGCAISTRKMLERLSGVQKAVVSYEKSHAVVTFDPEKVTVEQMIAAVKKLGYTATVMAE